MEESLFKKFKDVEITQENRSEYLKACPPWLRHILNKPLGEDKRVKIDK
jgi:hypothetical protein